MGEHGGAHGLESFLFCAGEAPHLGEPVDAHGGARGAQGLAESPHVGGETLTRAHGAQLVGEVLVEEAREHGGRQVRLGREVAVDRADRDAARGGDLAHGERGDAVARGDGVGLADQPLRVDHLFGHDCLPPRFLRRHILNGVQYRRTQALVNRRTEGSQRS